ncbi:MAG TPA: hypothetical protein PKK05_17385 [Leptospiraceae bacterium]|nr:hypothetical protein [Leptospiraceae bacterium]
MAEKNEEQKKKPSLTVDEFLMDKKLSKTQMKLFRNLSVNRKDFDKLLKEIL